MISLIVVNSRQQDPYRRLSLICAVEIGIQRKQHTKETQVHEGKRQAWSSHRGKLETGEGGSRRLGFPDRQSTYQKVLIKGDPTESTGSATKHSSINRQGKEPETRRVQLRL